MSLLSSSSFNQGDPLATLIHSNSDPSRCRGFGFGDEGMARRVAVPANGRGHVPNLEFPILVMEYASGLRKLKIHDMTASAQGASGTATRLGAEGSASAMRAWRDGWQSPGTGGVTSRILSFPSL